MTNLLEETTSYITSIGKTPSDIIFIGSERSGYSCNWEQFQALADVEYDSYYGVNEVALDLIVVFTDGTRMFREEFDGVENWRYFALFKMPANLRLATKLVASKLMSCAADEKWGNLDDLNEE